MATNYQRGRNAEYRVARWYREHGYPLVVRSAGSKGPADLVCVSEDDIDFVQVRIGKSPGKAAAMKYAEVQGGFPERAFLIWVRVDARKPLRFWVLRGHALLWRELTYRDGEWERAQDG